MSGNSVQTHLFISGRKCHSVQLQHPLLKKWKVVDPLTTNIISSANDGMVPKLVVVTVVFVVVAAAAVVVTVIFPVVAIHNRQYT